MAGRKMNSNLSARHLSVNGRKTGFPSGSIDDPAE
jgi:hypothetical protein